LLRRFHRALEEAGLPRMGVHDLRHWAGSLMLTAGILMPVVSRALGHSSIQVTVDIYGHLETATIQAEMQKYGRLLGAGLAENLRNGTDSGHVRGRISGA
ncbi:MAG: tyrosine-type recombinase/integrase, partial [Actinobacteria bacterium]|nr:tyrosine-type recombinase/integrase [Actinomycetota bacterium]